MLPSRPCHYTGHEVSFVLEASFPLFLIRCRVQIFRQVGDVVRAFRGLACGLRNSQPMGDSHSEP